MKNPALLFDVEHFDTILNRPDVSEEMRHAALKQLWELMGMCVDVGWGVYPMEKHGGENAYNGQNTPISSSDMLYSDKKTLMNKFIEITGLEGE